MIFGFNTDIRHGDTVYHVQSEARVHDLLLDSQIFVGGRCIGKRTSSYAHMLGDSAFSDAHLHEMLKSQHRGVLEALREGKLGTLLTEGTSIQDAEGQGLAVDWENSGPLEDVKTVVMHIRVTDRGVPVSGAKVTSRMGAAPDGPVTAKGKTDGKGMTELKIKLPHDDFTEIAILVQAQQGEKSATRKFRLRRPAKS